MPNKITTIFHDCRNILIIKKRINQIANFMVSYSLVFD
jgi:hypothetical protein